MSGSRHVNLLVNIFAQYIDMRDDSDQLAAARNPIQYFDSLRKQFRSNVPKFPSMKSISIRRLPSSG